MLNKHWHWNVFSFIFYVQKWHIIGSKSFLPGFTGVPFLLSACSGDAPLLCRRSQRWRIGGFVRGQGVLLLSSPCYAEGVGVRDGGQDHTVFRCTLLGATHTLASSVPLDWNGDGLAACAWIAVSWLGPVGILEEVCAPNLDCVQHFCMMSFTH